MEDIYINNDNFNILDSQIESYKNYLLNYNKQNEKDIEKFLIILSSYNWLTKNKKYINDIQDFEEKIELSTLIINNIEIITKLSKSIEGLKSSIEEYMDKSKELLNNRLCYDFRVTLCEEIYEVYEKIQHEKKYLNFIENEVKFKQKIK